MTQSPKDKAQTTELPHQKSAAILLTMTALDTTWRTFVPVIGGTFAGIGLDNWLHAAPIFTIIFLIIGTGLAALLVAKQLKDVRK